VLQLATRLLMIAEQLDDSSRQQFRIAIVGCDGQVRFDGHLVWIVYTGDPEHCAGTSPSVQTLRVASLAFLEGRSQIDLHICEAGVVVQRPDERPRGLEWRNQRHERDKPCVGEQARNLGDPPGVLVTIILRKPQIATQSSAQRVAIEDIGRSTGLNELAFDLACQSRLARAREPGEPDGGTVRSCAGATARLCCPICACHDQAPANSTMIIVPKIRCRRCVAIIEERARVSASDRGGRCEARWRPHRSGEPDEVAAVMSLLLSDDASFVTNSFT
jgi:hypothetical protein